MSQGIATTLTPDATKADAMSDTQRAAHDAFTKAATKASKGLAQVGTAMVSALKAGCHVALSLAPRTYLTQVLTAAGMARSSADSAAAMAFTLWHAPEAEGIPAEGLRLLARAAKARIRPKSPPRSAAPSVRLVPRLPLVPMAVRGRHRWPTSAPSWRARRPSRPQRRNSRTRLPPREA